MSTVYNVIMDDKYQSLEFSDFDAGFEAEEEGCWKIDGNPVGDNWEPLSVKIASPKSPKPDLWPVAGTYALEKRAAEILAPVLDKCCELLPLPFEDRELLVINITAVVDCFDMENGVCHPEFTYLIEEYAFVEQLITHSLFKIPQNHAYSLAAGDTGNSVEFKSLIEENGLKGVMFYPL